MHIHPYDDSPGWVWPLALVMCLPFLIVALVLRWPVPAAVLVLLVAVVVTLI